MKLKEAARIVLAHVLQMDPPPQMLTDSRYLNSVVECTLPKLVDMAFLQQLDAPATRRYVQFTGAVFDREQQPFTDPHPALCISLGTGYRHVDFDAPDEVKNTFGDFLRNLATAS
eukprot:1861164-Alexandrium_andersonii.AAC.1